VATIRERKTKDKHSIFHVQVRMTGYPARTASFPTRRQAERWAKTVEADMIEGRHFRNVEARRRTLADAIDRYVENELPKLRNGSTHRSNLPYWREAIGHLKLSEVTPAVIVEHRDKLAAGSYTRAKPGAKGSTLKKGEAARTFKRKPNTVNNYLVPLGRVFTVARKEWHWISNNPMDGVAKLNPGKGRVRHLSDDERERLLAETAKDPQLHCTVILALSTAPRAGEIINLRKPDIEFEEQTGPDNRVIELARLLLRETKNAEPRTAWLQGEALRVLKDHMEHGEARRLEKNRSKAREPEDDRVFLSVKAKRYDYSDDFATAMEAAKVTNFRFHDLRHSSATYLARTGATEQQLKAIGGWKSNVVSRYVHMAAEDTRDIVAKMNEKMLGAAK
jgi:integrase